MNNSVLFISCNLILETSKQNSVLIIYYRRLHLGIPYEGVWCAQIGAGIYARWAQKIIAELILADLVTPVFGQQGQAERCTHQRFDK